MKKYFLYIFCATNFFQAMENQEPLQKKQKKEITVHAANQFEKLTKETLLQIVNYTIPALVRDQDEILEDSEEFFDDLTMYRNFSSVCKRFNTVMKDEKSISHLKRMKNFVVKITKIGQILASHIMNKE